MEHHVRIEVPCSRRRRRVRGNGNARAHHCAPASRTRPRAQDIDLEREDREASLTAARRSSEAAGIELPAVRLPAKRAAVHAPQSRAGAPQLLTHGRATGNAVCRNSHITRALGLVGKAGHTHGLPACLAPSLLHAARYATTTAVPGQLTCVSRRQVRTSSSSTRIRWAISVVSMQMLLSHCAHAQATQNKGAPIFISDAEVAITQHDQRGKPRVLRCYLSCVLA
jgi:hypothetical protein